MVYILINMWLDCLKLFLNVCYGSVCGGGVVVVEGGYWFKGCYGGEFKVENESYKKGI